ncbi:MAG: hypothetical protein ACYSUV_21285 [Planctomycetota bacterium]|jgi:hypothetical protein
MSLVVVFDEGATPERVLDVVRSAHTPDYASRTDVVINPDISAVDGIVAQLYWKHDTGLIVEMTQAEKDALDAAIAAALDAATRGGAKAELNGFASLPLLLRAFADVVKDEVNILRALHSIPDRTLAQLRTAIDGRIDSGDVDT